MDAQALLKAVQQRFPQVTGISIGDLNDPATWRFDSKEPLSKADYASAVSVVQSALIPTVIVILPPQPTTTDLDNIIRWGGKHFGQTLDEAKTEIAALIPVVGPPDPLGAGG